jgi:adenylate cyclase
MRKTFRQALMTSLVVSTLTFLGIMGLRLLGALEALELMAYDGYLSARDDTTKADTRITLVTITEEDIHEYGWPISDGLLKQALEKLNHYQPRVIGLDIYRDFPEFPNFSEPSTDINLIARLEAHAGRYAQLQEVLSASSHLCGGERRAEMWKHHDDLCQALPLASVFNTHTNIVTAMYMGTDQKDCVPPPFCLQHPRRVGFTDVILDADGVVRRALLLLQDDEGTVFYSLPLRVALRYLQEEKPELPPQKASDSDLNYIQLGNTMIPPFGKHDGGYVNPDTRGYQLLVDFRGTRQAFRSLQLKQLLEGQFPPEAVQDKVVFIGVTAASVKDFFHTPYPRDFQVQRQMEGVAFQAHLVSQLLRYGLEGDRPITPMQPAGEVLWLFLWSVMGGAAGFVAGPLWRFGLLGAGTALGLGFTVYIALGHGWWIPIVPPALAWLIAAPVSIYMIRGQKKMPRIDQAPSMSGDRQGPAAPEPSTIAAAKLQAVTALLGAIITALGAIIAAVLAN